MGHSRPHWATGDMSGLDLSSDMRRLNPDWCRRLLLGPAVLRGVVSRSSTTSAASRAGLMKSLSMSGLEWAAAELEASLEVADGHTGSEPAYSITKSARARSDG